jgi:hypothetical protein
MKSLRQFCATLFLTVLLATATFADEGIIHGGYAPPPPPPPAAGGIIHGGLTVINVETTSQETTTDLATEITLHLIQSMLALF